MIEDRTSCFLSRVLGHMVGGQKRYDRRKRRGCKNIPTQFERRLGWDTRLCTEKSEICYFKEIRQVKEVPE